MKKNTNGAQAAGSPRRWRPLAGAMAAGALAAGGLATLSLNAPSAQAMESAMEQTVAEAVAETAAAIPGHGGHTPAVEETSAPETEATDDAGHEGHAPAAAETAAPSPEATAPTEPAADPGHGDGDHGDHAPSPDPKYSTAYTERNWTPTKYDTCSKELHAGYTALGPDGKIYPTWHPAQVTDPATGTLCTFGHEHGADPATSDIYTWVVDYLTPDDADGAKTGIPFGYASEALMMYGAEHEGMAMRHEDNAGHKIFIANDVQLIDENRDWVTAPGPGGTAEPVTCDFLIKQHQGSWSPDATSNNAHEAIYASRCSDGTEIISTTLSKFGNSNQFNKNCGTLGTVATGGSKLPAGYGGSRQIPDADCVSKHATGAAASLWGMYELWKGENRITAEDGTLLANFDPWFGLRNPSRYYDAANSTYDEAGNAKTNGVSRPVSLVWGANPATTFPWNTVPAAEMDWQDPASPFDGAQRDFYLNQNRVLPGTPAAVYTDPYGTGGSETEFIGSIRQHLVSGSATTTATLSTQKFDTDADFGRNNGVHAPN